MKNHKKTIAMLLTAEDVEVTWDGEPVAPVEAIMQAAGLRG